MAFTLALMASYYRTLRENNAMTKGSQVVVRLPHALIRIFHHGCKTRGLDMYQYTPFGMHTAEF